MITEILECSCIPFRAADIVAAHADSNEDVYPMVGFLVLSEAARIGISIGVLFSFAVEGRAFERSDLGATLAVYMGIGALLGFLAARYERGLPPPTDEI